MENVESLLRERERFLTILNLEV